MTHLFYISIAFFALHEANKAIHPKYIHAEYGKLFRMSKADRNLYLDYAPALQAAVFIDVIETLFIILGLFSGEWPFFLLVLLLMLSQFQRLGAWATFLDAALTFSAFLAAILFHYNVISL